MSMEYPCIFFEKDGKCRKFSGENTTSYCVMGPCPEQKLSNADRIRAMSDEKLAEFLCSVFDDEDCNGKYIFGVTIQDYDEYSILDWLKQPAEEGT